MIILNVVLMALISAAIFALLMWSVHTQHRVPGYEDVRRPSWSQDQRQAFAGRNPNSLSRTSGPNAGSRHLVRHGIGPLASGLGPWRRPMRPLESERWMPRLLGHATTSCAQRRGFYIGQTVVPPERGSGRQHHRGGRHRLCIKPGGCGDADRHAGCRCGTISAVSPSARDDRATHSRPFRSDRPCRSTHRHRNQRVLGLPSPHCIRSRQTRSRKTLMCPATVGYLGVGSSRSRVCRRR